MATEKKQRPRWVVPVSLGGAVILTTIYMSIVTGGEFVPFGVKGEGLAFMLIFYLVLRVTLSLFLWVREKISAR